MRSCHVVFRMVVAIALTTANALVATNAQAQAPGNELHSAVTELARKIAESYAPLKSGSLDRLAVLSFDEIGAEVGAKQLGKVTSELLMNKLVESHTIKLVERTRLAELAKEVKLQNTAGFDATTAQQIGTFLGAQALVLGSVAEAGADFLLTARLVSAKTGEVLLAADVTVPRAGLIALAENAVEKRSKVGAIYRAVLPGWGQFYNGPEHHWKGYVIAGGSLMAIGTGVSALMLATRKADEKQSWEPAASKYLAQGCDGNVVGGEAACLKKQQELQDAADRNRLIGYSAFGVFGALWLWGLVDAAIYGEDYEGVRVAVVPQAPNLKSGMVGVLEFSF